MRLVGLRHKENLVSQVETDKRVSDRKAIIHSRNENKLNTDTIELLIDMLAILHLKKDEINSANREQVKTKLSIAGF